MEKVKTFTVDYGGEKIIFTDIESVAEYLKPIEPEIQHGEDTAEIEIIIEYKYTQAELDSMPEYQ